MTTQFFERQEVQRSQTRVLVGGFIAAMLVVVLAVNLILIWTMGGGVMFILRQHPEVVLVTSSVVIAIILVASIYKATQLRAGGEAVARSLGGEQVYANDPDPARKRLDNIVEEMAIAARVRKPLVFVLPDEPGINAFAAGTSPDHASVAVTQGALDNLSREQLQAVIGHEFSHILNGDMQINMRLAALLFGLYVFTNIALRVLRNRGRGKRDGRVMLIAFGAFVVGSLGMFAGRLLQAAISRRREHLADASSVQFTRNPQALLGAFLVMEASDEGTRLMHAEAEGVAHMFFAGSAPLWANKLGGSWLATHPTVSERLRALDANMTPSRIKTLLSEERRRLASSRARQAPSAQPGTESAAAGSTAARAPNNLMAAAMVAAVATRAPGTQPQAPAALAETLPSGVRLIAGRALPPDLLRNRLSKDQQASIAQYLAQIETKSNAVVATFVAAMLASEPAKARLQLARLAPMLGIELMRETQAEIVRFAQLSAVARLPLLTDLLALLDELDPELRKRLRAIARAFAPTVAAGDMLRYAVTRLIEKRLAKSAPPPTPVPLHERTAAVCELYAALAHTRFSEGKQGQNAYRAGLMGMMPPKNWAPYPDSQLAPAQLDATITALAQVHPTGRRSLSEGMARVVAVGGRLTVPQVDLLRAACLLIGCALPAIPIDVVFEENQLPGAVSQLSAR